MRLISATIKQNTEFLPCVHLVTLHAPDIACEAKPGQFIMVNCGESCLLPRPISIHSITAGGDVFLLVNKVGKGTGWLAERREGDIVQIIGPLGNGYTISPDAKNLLLVAGGIGIAPLVFLAQQASPGKSVTLLIGATTEALLYPVSRLPQNVQVVRTTDDGSTGQKGMVTDVLPKYLKATDQVLACGPVAMYLNMQKQAVTSGKAEIVQVSLEVRMGCGIGTCYGCSIRTHQGMKKVCKDGPVFRLSDVMLDEVKV